MNSSNRKQRIRGASLSRWSISLVILGLLSSPPTAVAIERGAVERVREGYVERIERDLALIEGGKIKLVSDVGSIELDTQAGNRLRLIVVKEVDTSDELEAEKAFKAFEVNIHAGSTVRIIGQQVGLSRLQARVRYSLTIPERYDLDLRTGGGGAITISDRVGRVAAVTNSGSISIEAAEGEVEAEAGGGGSISVVEARGKVDVKTNSGSIRLGVVEGPVEAEAGGGGGIAVESAAGRMRVTSNSGSIEIGIAGSDIEAEAGGGGRITIRRSVGKVSARTNSASIEVEAAVVSRSANHKE